ncbi:MAG: PilN domain-containing protein [Armatimonadota bacterium]|nr:PilN domain-containing protein [bacterium]
MRPFNLAEMRIAERGFCRQHINRHLRAIMLLIAVALCVAVGSQACRQTIMNKATRVKSELAGVQQKRVAIKRRTAGVDARLSQRGWQRQLAAGSRQKLKMMESVTACAPDDVWLSAIESSQENAGLLIQGQAATVESMTVFIDRLKTDAGFKEVRLTSAKIAGQNGSSFVDFSLEAREAFNIK